MTRAYPFQRDDVLSLLRRRVSGFAAGYRKNLALLGPPGCGKTILLNRLLQEGMLAGALLVPVYVEVRREENVVEWATRFTQSLFYSLLQARKVSPLPRELPDLIGMCAGFAPRMSSAATRVLRLAEQGKSDEAYDLLWELPLLAGQESGCQMILVLDEFHRLRGLPVKEPFRPLGRRIMVQNGSLYIVASSQPQMARGILREGLALLFGQFEILELAPLSPMACLQSLREAWPGVREDPLLEETLLELTQGHAATLDLLLGGLRRQLGQAGSRTPERLLLDLLRELFVGAESELRGSFEARLRSLPAHHTRPFCLQVLCEVASGRHRLAEIAGRLDRPSTQAARALLALEQAGLVQRRGAFFKVPERLFEMWMRMGYPVLRGIGVAGSEEAQAAFDESAAAWIAQLRYSMGRSVVERVVDLMKCWRGEVVELDGRRTLLPAFSAIQVVDGPLKRPAIIARRSGRDATEWKVILWDGPLGETEAREMADGLRDPDHAGRAVLIGAYPIDIHARLILQQAHVRLWDLLSLNGLLDLYGQPVVSVPREFELSLAEEVSIPPPVMVQPADSAQGTG